MSQHKYILDLIKEADLENVRPVRLPMDPTLKIQANSGPLMPNLEEYRRLVKKAHLLDYHSS